MTIKTIPLAKIRTDGGSQLRHEIDEATIRSYSDLVIDGATFPPVEVFHDGTDNWLADGFHRFFAHQQAGKESIRCDVAPGTRREAVLFAAGANAKNGLRRTNDDKRKAVQTLLEDEEWAAWSDRAVAKACAVSASLVETMRKQLLENAVEAPRKGLDGKVRKMPSASMPQLAGDPLVHFQGEAEPTPAASTPAAKPSPTPLEINGHKLHLSANGGLTDDLEVYVDSSEEDSQDGTTEGDGNQDGTDEEPGHEAPSLAKLLLDGDPYAIWCRKLESTWPDNATVKQKVAWLDCKICELREDPSW